MAAMESGALESPSPEVGVYHRLPFEIVEGDGVVLRDQDGREYLDFYGGHAVTALGYRHPRLLRAIETQATRLFFQSNATPAGVRDRAARKLVEFAPAGLDHVFFCNSGAEANENQLRLAFRATGRPRVVAVEGAFHGRTAAAAACTWGAARWYAFPRPPFDVTFVPPDDVAALDAAVGDDVAAVILEPVQGMAGARPLSVAFLREARRLTTERGACLLADEVQCGVGRTGRPLAIEHADVVPDAASLAKGIAGGFPAGVVLVGDRLAAGLGPGDLGTTFGGGPLAAAMIETVLDVIREEDLLARVRRISADLMTRARVGPVVRVQGAGFLVGLVTGPPARDVLLGLRERGILAGSSADPHVVRLMPPLILDEAHVDRLVAALAELPS